jgi:hypothetical protein
MRCAPSPPNACPALLLARIIAPPYHADTNHRPPPSPRSSASNRLTLPLSSHRNAPPVHLQATPLHAPPKCTLLKRHFRPLATAVAIPAPAPARVRRFQLRYNGDPRPDPQLLPRAPVAFAEPRERSAEYVKGVGGQAESGGSGGEEESGAWVVGRGREAFEAGERGWWRCRDGRGKCTRPGQGAIWGTPAQDKRGKQDAGGAAGRRARPQ